MQRLQIELIIALDRPEAHRGPPHGLGDRFRIDEVVLVRLYVRLHVLRRNQPHVVPLLLERGITVRQGRSHMEAALPGILEDAEANLSGAMRFLLAQLSVELEQTSQRIQEADAAIQTTVRENDACRRLVGIPGVGPVTATAMIAAIGNGAAFRKGREFAAWVGVVPRQRSTGGKQTMLGISKRGNAYLRRLFVQGARAVLQQKASQSAGLRAWLDPLTARSHHHVACVWLWRTSWRERLGRC